MEPINNPSGISINGYDADDNIDELIEKHSNLTYVYLDENADTLRKAYNLPPDMKLYILVIDTPNFNRTVPINMYMD